MDNRELAALTNLTGHQLTIIHHLVAKQRTTGKLCDTLALRAGQLNMKQLQQFLKNL